MAHQTTIDSERLDQLLLIEKRYNFLQNATGLRLTSNNMVWTRKDGSKFRSTHKLDANYTVYRPFPTLDETIDHAIKTEEEKYCPTNDLVFISTT